MRPLAKAMTQKLGSVRKKLREQCFKNGPLITEKVTYIEQNYINVIAEMSTYRHNNNCMAILLDSRRFDSF